MCSSASFAQAISSWKVWHLESSISKRATFLQKVRSTSISRSISSVRIPGYCLITPKASAVVPFVFMSPSHLRNGGKYGRPEQTEINLGIEIIRWGLLRKHMWSSNVCELLACSLWNSWYSLPILTWACTKCCSSALPDPNASLMSKIADLLMFLRPLPALNWLLQSDQNYAFNVYIVWLQAL